MKREIQIRPDGCRLETDWKRFAVIELDSTASGSTSNGGATSPGPIPDPPTSRSSTITEEVPPKTVITRVHPGELLMQEFLASLEINQNRLAVASGMPQRRINEIGHRKRRISAVATLGTSLSALEVSSMRADALYHNAGIPVRVGRRDRAAARDTPPPPKPSWQR